MPGVRWEIEGYEFGNCSCSYACPCHFKAQPTQGYCLVVFGFHIVRGYHGKIRLDGLKAATIARFPGPIHEGRGELVTILDESANEAQRKSLLSIMRGDDAAPGSFFQIFATSMEKMHPPLFAAVDFDIDVDRRRAKLVVPGFVQAVGEPIIDPATGMEHHVRIEVPQGFNSRCAEIGRGWTVTEEPIPFDLADTYGRFARLRMNQDGVAA
jgi:hypothetical protein